eukprot:3320054-Pyramimonas_sp.AAC.1
MRSRPSSSEQGSTPLVIQRPCAGSLQTLQGMSSVSGWGSSPPSTSSFVIWTLNPSTWSAAQAMLEWAKHDRQGVPVLPDVLCLQEHRLEDAFRRQSAV